MGQISIYVEADEVLHELSDADLIGEVRRRKMAAVQGEDRIADLERALDRRDWEEVGYLLRAYVLPSYTARSHWPARRDPATGRPIH